MSMQLKLIAGLLLIASIIGGMYSLFQYGRHVEGLERDNIAAQAAIQNEAIKAKLQGEAHEAQKRIDDLAADNKRLRVLLPKNTCQPNPASGSVQAPAMTPGSLVKE